MIDLNPVELEPEPFYDPMNDIVYRLFTRDNPETPQLITHDLETVRSSNWNANRPARFVIHGWNGGGPNSMASVRRELLANGDLNVVSVDWGAGGNTANYLAARNRVGPTGTAIATLISNLVQGGLAAYSRTNVIGHSLGAHVAGHTGKATTGGRINAIFGTDAAGPLFNINNPTERFDIEDAVYTENIHTNIEGLNALGFDQPITHAAFYPAWGGRQPGCGDNGCDHGRSNGLYNESLRPNHQLIARQCANYNEIVSRNCPGTGITGLLGGDDAKSIRGVFFLNTNAQSPFGQG
jgi:hypothetical protein